MLGRGRQANTFQPFMHISQSDTHKTTTQFLFDLSRNGDGALLDNSLTMVGKA